MDIMPHYQDTTRHGAISTEAQYQNSRDDASPYWGALSKLRIKGDMVPPTTLYLAQPVSQYQQLSDLAVTLMNKQICTFLTKLEKQCQIWLQSIV